MNTKLNVFLLLAQLGISPAIFAENLDIPQDPPTVIGVVGQSAPRYSGSKDNTWQVDPLFQMRKGAFFIDTTKGIGYDLQAENGLYLEHTLGYSFGRAEKNSSWREGAKNLQGMGEIKGSLNTAVALGWQMKPWLIPEIKVTLPLTQSEGSQFQASLTLIPLQTSDDTVAVQAVILAADDRYMNTYYGVNFNQQQRSGYRQYHAKGGLLGTQLNINWTHQLDQHWGTLLGGTYNRLADHAADSPIVGRRNTTAVNVGVTYSY